MVKHEIIDEYLHLHFGSYQNKPYSISVTQLGQIWDTDLIGDGDSNIRIPNLSRWVIHILKTKTISKVDMVEVYNIIKAITPESKVDWEATSLAIKIIYDYRELSKKDDPQEKFTAVFAEQKQRMEKTKKIIEILKERFELTT